MMAHDTHTGVAPLTVGPRYLPPEDPADWPTVPQTERAPPADAVRLPGHYRQGDIECIDAIHAALGDEGFVEYARGNAMQYVWRSPHKGTAAQDLRKAAQYLQFAANVMAGRKPREDA